MVAQSVRRIRSAACALLVALFTAPAFGAVPVHIVKTDLEAGIRAAAHTPVQFAVLVPHAVSTTTGGTWSTQQGKATWRYAVQVPTAVSLSFHAVGSALPDSATLIVQGAKTTTSYRARDLHRGELWSRIHPGDALQLTLTVAAADRSRVALTIVTLQAGYRALGPGVSDHPYYRQLKAQLAGTSGNSACVTNYECQVTAANTPVGSATVALVVGNLYQCSGTLINDVPQDNTPYVLTGRHCESGKMGGGNPGAASSVTVYWDATTSCGAALGSIYDPHIPTQGGARTVVEQQDAWLIVLDSGPVVADAQLAGFDASGSAVQGGYTIQHAEGNDKQFTGWYGQAAAVQQNNVLGTSYLSNFWETVNQLGNVGPGASGSGLFDQHNRLVGSLSLGRQTNDPSGYQSCPAVNPPAPDGTNGVADFTALEAVWDSIADTTSTTGSTTIKSVLDPANSGALTVSSAAVRFLNFDAAEQAASVGDSVVLSWDATGASQCTAGGGVSGDGWSGALAASGNKPVTESAANAVTYTLSCSYAGGGSARSSVTVTWLGPTPVLQFNGPATVWTDAPATLSWTSNVGPCSITGGGLALTNLAASGTTTTTQAAPGDVNYDLTCGPAVQAGSYPITVAYVTPSLVFEANGTDRLIGVPFFLKWTTAATVCTPSGGAPNDGWSTTEFVGAYASNAAPYYLKVTTAGSYTYSLTCSAGPNSVQKSVTVTFEHNPPYVNLSINPATVTYSHSPADYAKVTWKTNLGACGFATNPNLLLAIDSDPYLSDGDQVAEPSGSGTYQVSVACYPNSGSGPNGPAATATATLTVLPPAPAVLGIRFNPATVVSGESFNAAWSATNVQDCELTGGIPNELWGSSAGFGFAPTGYDQETGVAGQYTFGLTCRSIDPNSPTVSTQATINIGALTATLNSSATSVSFGASFTLTWSSVGATRCAAGGGGASGSGWSGGVGTSGSATQAAKVSGTFTYSLVCSAGNVSTSPQQVMVTVSAAPDGSGSSRSGGGALGLLELALLAVLGARRRLASVGRAAASQGTP